MAANTWARVGGNTLDAVNPGRNPLVNPKYPGINDKWGYQSEIVRAWCGATWNEADGELWLPLSGGHGNYGGNEPYRMVLSDDTPVWAMMRAPSGALPGNLNLKDGQEATGMYADGRPRAIHSYSSVVWAPGIGNVSAGNSSVYSAVGGPSLAWSMSPYSHEWTPHNAWLPVQTGAVNTAAYDPLRHRLWVRSGVLRYLAYLDLQNWSWTTTKRYDSAGGIMRLVYLEGLDALALFSDDLPSTFRIYTNLDDQPSLTTITPLGAIPAGLMFNGKMGVEWDGARLLLWHNSGNTVVVSTLTPGGGATGVWTWGALPVAPANSVTPSAAQTFGTYGRFGYSAKLGGCFLLNSTTEPVFFFATE